MLGAGVATQLAALPSELDASFARALPLLQEQVIRPGQEKDVRKILAACSLTYIASSLAAVLSLWPWLGRARLSAPLQLHVVALLAADADGVETEHSRPAKQAGMRPVRARRRKKRGMVEDLVRQVGKPLIRGWFRLVYDR